MSSSSGRNTTQELSLAESYRIAWNRLFFDDFRHEAEFLTNIYSELLDIPFDNLSRYARNGHWQFETRIVSITQQAQRSQNVFVAALCLADTAMLLKRKGRGAEAKRIDRIAEQLNDLSHELKQDGE
jgi:hypothetical protein